ncbi:MAG: hypothetical protein K8R21_03940 [Leptospira sp.]|nr:hypothetical protein [Leptospira sp.]
MNLPKPLSIFSVICFLQGIFLFAYLLFLHFTGKTFPDIAYSAFVPVLQIIFGIWAWKGKENAVFSKSIFILRIPFLLFLILNFIATGYPSSTAHFSSRAIFLISSFVELAGLILLFSSLRKDWWKEAKIFILRNSRWEFEEKNRLVFGIYIIGLGIWLLADPNQFLATVRMPVADNPKILFAVGIQVIILGSYNLIASVHSIKPLIEAGIHGGFFTSVVFILLVVTGIFHPMTLLIPLADIISIAMTIGKRIFNK